MTEVELRNLAAKLRTLWVNPQDNVFIYRAADELEKLTQQISVPTTWRPDMAHLANEWADCAMNGLQGLKNIRDGISTTDEVIEIIVSNLAHCKDVSAAVRATPQTDVQQVAVPMTQAEIIAVAQKSVAAEPGRDGYILPVSFAKAIEAHHKITPQGDKQ